MNMPPLRYFIIHEATIMIKILKEKHLLNLLIICHHHNERKQEIRR